MVSKKSQCTIFSMYMSWKIMKISQYILNIYMYVHL